MSTCDRVSNRMPDVQSGAAEWSVEEEQHLDACPDCAAEWRLVQAARRLGGVAPPAAAGPLAASVLARVRAREASARRWRRRAAIGGLAGLAAAATLALSVVRRQPDPLPSATTQAGIAIPLVELDDATDVELQAVLAAFEPALSTEGVLGVEWEGMNESDIEHALRAWEES